MSRFWKHVWRTVGLLFMVKWQPSSSWMICELLLRFGVSSGLDFYLCVVWTCSHLFAYLRFALNHARRKPWAWYRPGPQPSEVTLSTRWSRTHTTWWSLKVGGPATVSQAIHNQTWPVSIGCTACDAWFSILFSMDSMQFKYYYFIINIQELSLWIMMIPEWIYIWAFK